MLTGGFGEPLAFSLRIRKVLRARRGDFDIVHDNQCLGTGISGLVGDGWPLLETLHHPITVDRSIALDHADKRVEALHDPALVRVLAHAGARRARDARRADRLAQLQGRHPRADGRAARAAHRRARRGRPRPCSAPTTTSSSGRAGSWSRPAATCPMKGLVPLLEAVAKLRAERDIELVGDRPAPAQGPRRRGDRRASGSRTSSPPSPGSATRSSPASTARPRSRSCRASTRGSRCRRSRRWPARCRSWPRPAGRCPRSWGSSGETGLLVEPNDPDALVAAIRACSTTRRCARRLGANGRERVVQRFTWQVTARGTAACYDAILRGEALPDSMAVRLMLTADYGRLGLLEGDTVLDLGCGFGRHAFEAARRGAHVVALDAGRDEVEGVVATFVAMAQAGELEDVAAARRGRPGRRAAPALRRRHVRPRHLLGGPRAHPRRRGGDGRARARPAPRGHDGGHRAALRARGGQLGAVGRVPQRPRRPRAHLLASRARVAPVLGGPARRGAPPRARTAQPLLVAQVPRRARRNDQNPLVRAYHRLLVWDIVSGAAHDALRSSA